MIRCMGRYPYETANWVGFPSSSNWISFWKYYSI